MWTHGKQSGFTLVEIAIVLVIIGLILAAVLKGQEMILNARTKNVINDLRGVSTAYYAYLDRYYAIPGDDPAANRHFASGVNGDGDGFISGLFSASGTTLVSGGAAESEKFWQHTRMAGFLTGSGSNPATNALGGLLGVQSQITATPSTYGIIGNVVCAGSIPWKIALAVDTMIDDGNSDTGTVRAGLNGANLATVVDLSHAYGVNVAPADTDTIHTVCMKI